MVINWWRWVYTQSSSVYTDALLTDVNISTNRNTFDFWASEYEYIKKLKYEYTFFKIDLNASNMLYFAALGHFIFSQLEEYEYNYPVRDMDLGPALQMHCTEVPTFFMMRYSMANLSNQLGDMLFDRILISASLGGPKFINQAILF